MVPAGVREPLPFWWPAAKYRDSPLESGESDCVTNWPPPLDIPPPAYSAFGSVSTGICPAFIICPVLGLTVRVWLCGRQGSALPPTIPLGSVHLSPQSTGRPLISPLSSCSGKRHLQCTAVHKRTLYCDAVTTKRQLEMKTSTGHNQHSNVFNVLPVDGQLKVWLIAHF